MGSLSNSFIMEKQENKGKTPEQEEKKIRDYESLRESIEQAEQKGLSYLFLAANTEGLVFAADLSKNEMLFGLIELMIDHPEYKELFIKALVASTVLDK